MTNEEMVKKAIVTTDAIATSGKLNPQQADKFIDYVIDVSGLKNNARVVRFRNEQLDIDKIGVAKRVAMPATEAVSPSSRRGISTSKVSLSPKEIIVPFEISDNFMENNLEGASVEDHIIKMMATQLANDMETLYIEGDVLGRAVLESDLLENGSTQYVKDSYLALFDGWLRKADGGHVVDIAGANVGTSAFSKMLNALPAKFKRNRGELRFLTSIDLEQLYREKVASRATIGGDTALSSNMNLTPFGIPLVPFPLFPFKYREVEHIILTGNPGNAIALRRKPVANVVVTLTTLGNQPTTPLVETTDYVVDYTNGTVARVQGGAIADPTTVKVTYDANPTVVLTHYMNLIIGIGRDIRIEKDRDIYKRVNQYAITCKLSVQTEEVDAISKGVNFGTG